MKKLCSIIILFGILILISNSVFASENWRKENKKREEAYTSALETYLESFKTEETSEEDRIKDYMYTGFSDGIDGHVTISFQVTPVNENNTTWSKYRNYCFAVFSKVNDEYVLERISRYPDNYDKFLERFEEYKRNNTEIVENVQIQGEEITNNLSNQKIEKMSSTIFIICSIVLFSTICFVIIKLYIYIYSRR